MSAISSPIIATLLFVQQLVQSTDKENNEICFIGSLLVKSTHEWWISLTKGRLYGKRFPSHDVVVQIYPLWRICDAHFKECLMHLVMYKYLVSFERDLTILVTYVVFRKSADEYWNHLVSLKRMNMIKSARIFTWIHLKINTYCQLIIDCNSPYQALFKTQCLVSHKWKLTRQNCC